MYLFRISFNNLITDHQTLVVLKSNDIFELFDESVNYDYIIRHDWTDILNKIITTSSHYMLDGINNQFNTEIVKYQLRVCVIPDTALASRVQSTFESVHKHVC